jgi:hypothetical protein
MVTLGMTINGITSMSIRGQTQDPPFALMSELLQITKTSLQKSSIMFYRQLLSVYEL